jgi:isopentenyldiphosphate isomerase
MEILDIVDLEDKVIGKASRDDIYKNLHTHRIVHVLLFDKKGRMALQLRSKKVSFCPNHWSTAVGGHVQTGETYETAAMREFEEELGTKTKIEFLFRDFFINPNNQSKKFLETFKAIYEGPFNPNLDDIEKVQFFSIKEIQEMINKGEKFHPELLFLLKKNYGIK